MNKSGKQVAISFLMSADAHGRDEASEKLAKPWGMLVPSDENLSHVSLEEKEFTLGRSNRCSFRIAHAHISGLHFKITLQEVKNLTIVSIVDLSSNGTFVNQVRVSLTPAHLFAIEITCFLYS